MCVTDISFPSHSLYKQLCFLKLLFPKLARPSAVRAGGGSMGLVSDWDKEQTARTHTNTRSERWRIKPHTCIAAEACP